MADCEVEGTIASPLSIPLERAMSPTGERSDEGTAELDRIRWDRKRGRRAHRQSNSTTTTDKRKQKGNALTAPLSLDYKFVSSVRDNMSEKNLTVWCALWAGGIIGPYFFKHDEGHNVTVNGDRYRAMITNFFIPELNNNDVQELWFQQDGATCHTARATIDLLKDTFGDHLISRFGPVNWPPRSCDLTPLDYFLWGYVKSLVYADKPQTLDHLEDNIRRVIADIRPQMLEKVTEN
ncbi:transposable element Tc3 transposase [Trichonephila clavipes]|nr:transposable element Tc3 transposase [Trichonephila clavipes]